MSGKERVYEDDDGRTIADMSGVPRPGLAGWRGRLRTGTPGQTGAEFGADTRGERGADGYVRADRPWEEHTVSKDERRLYVLGALRAALLIAAAFIGGLGLLTAFLLWLWR